MRYASRRNCVFCIIWAFDSPGRRKDNGYAFSMPLPQIIPISFSIYSPLINKAIRKKRVFFPYPTLNALHTLPVYKS